MGWRCGRLRWHVKQLSHDDEESAIFVFKTVSGYTDPKYRTAMEAKLKRGDDSDWYGWALHWFWLHGEEYAEPIRGLRPYIVEDAGWLLGPHAATIYKAKLIRRLE